MTRTQGFYLLLATAVAFSSCTMMSKKDEEKTDDKELSLKEKELELREREIALKEQEAQKGANTATAKVTTPNTPPQSVKPSPAPEVAKAKPVGSKMITGEGVIMREQASSTSNKLGSFKKGEFVEVLDKKSPENPNEAITATEVKLFSDYNGKFITKLNKGKALKIERKEGDTYYVSYQHPEYGKLYATLPSASIESTANLTWFKVRTGEGKTGWVLSKFVE
ncbi:MAG: hypothetical protein ACKVTZ_04180 [Bacteroidia bacterium]